MNYDDVINYSHQKKAKNFSKWFLNDDDIIPELNV